MKLKILFQKVCIANINWDTVLYDDFVSEGPNRLSFNISSLNIGAYLVTISQNGEIIHRKKLIRN